MGLFIGHYENNNSNTLPADGYPLTFKQFVKKDKGLKMNVELDKQDILVKNFCDVVEYRHSNKNNLTISNFDDLNLKIYFLYLTTLYYNKDSKLETHGRWIGQNMTYEELYTLVDRGVNMEVTHKGIIYKGEGENIFINYF